ncbi:hypothetical protein CsatB_021168 [Cannabis sativa]
MQASLSIISPTLIPLKPSKKPSQLTLFPSKLSTSFTSRNSSVKANVVTTNDTNTVNYNSPFSVFPAEACETIGGEACFLKQSFNKSRLTQHQLQHHLQRPLKENILSTMIQKQFFEERLVMILVESSVSMTIRRVCTRENMTWFLVYTTLFYYVIIVVLNVYK